MINPYELAPAAYLAGRPAGRSGLCCQFPAWDILPGRPYPFPDGSQQPWLSRRLRILPYVAAPGAWSIGPIPAYGQGNGFSGVIGTRQVMFARSGLCTRPQPCWRSARNWCGWSLMAWE